MIGEVVSGVRHKTKRRTTGILLAIPPTIAAQDTRFPLAGPLGSINTLLG